MGGAMRSAQPIRVVVIGAGIAGLTAALRLAERGFQVDVLEERLFTGGKLGGHRHIIRSMPVRNFTADGQSGEISRKPYAELTALEQLAVDATQSINAFEEYLGQFAYRVEAWIGEYLNTRNRLLCPRVQASISVKAGSFELRQCAIRHGAEKCWAAIGKSSDGHDFCFNLAVYRRGDQTLRVELSDDTYHEHCYHLFLNWYRNFWELMKSIRRERTQAFQPMNTLTHLFSGAGRPKARMRTLKGVSSISNAADNLLSGAEPIPDML